MPTRWRRSRCRSCSSGRSNSSPTGIESFVTDIHARDHRVKAKIGVKNDGTITAWEIDDLTGIGPYSVYPRTSGIEANQIVNLTGGPYTCPNYRARARVVFQNKNVMCQYRAVGHPIATAVTEGLVELAAAEDRHGPAGNPAPQSDPRRRLSVAAPSGIKFEALSHHECAGASRCDDELRRAARRAEAAARKQGIYRGIGFATFIEVTNPSAAFYGVGGAQISAQDGVHRAGSTRRARSSARPASPSRARAPRPSSRRSRPRPSACRSSACASSPATPTTRPMAAAPGPRARAGIGGEAAWQAGKALRANVLAVRRRRSCRPSPRPRHPQRRRRRHRQRHRAPAARMSSPASPISAPTRCRPASRPS